VTPESVPQLLTLLAVAKALCVSPHTVRSWVRKGKLRPVRLCRRLLFDPDDLVRLLQAAKAASNGESAGPVQEPPTKSV
jgi:DNA-binding transcriptional MerR regulator